MFKSKFKSKPKKDGVNHLKPAFKTTEIYEKIRLDLQLSQYQAFDEIIQFFDPQGSNPNKFMLLTGSAGTGKTYLAGKVAEYLQTAYFCNILMCAPTNKAVKVLKATQDYKTGINFFTIHAALGLQEEIDNDGNIVFRNQKPSAVKIRDYDFVILDEASMVDDVLLQTILKEITTTDIKILFVGDRFQIPPVNYAESAVFKEETKEKYTIKEIELTAIIRQHHNNPIISFANQLKASLDNPLIVSELTCKAEFQNIPQITFLPKDKDILLSVLRKYFLTEEFDLDADYCRVIAWTNERVNKFNMLIRKLRYGADAPQLMIGEKLIFDRPWMMKRNIVYGTNEEVTVRSFKDGSIDIYDNFFTYYDTTVSKEGSTEEEKYHIDILKQESYPAFESVKAYLRGQALQHKKGSEESKGFWSSYYNFIGKFAAVKYSYSITCHKSQGSTYINAVVANYDINHNLSVIERNRIKYTAVTRPKENLYIIV